MKDLIRVESVEEIIVLPANLEEIFIARLDDQKLQALAKLSNLRKLTQDGNCSVTDEGLKTIAAFRRLEELDLEWAGDITDEGLQKLHQLSELRWLDLGFCRKVTDGGIKMLQNKLPRCKILR